MSDTMPIGWVCWNRKRKVYLERAAGPLEESCQDLGGRLQCGRYGVRRALGGRQSMLRSPALSSFDGNYPRLQRSWSDIRDANPAPVSISVGYTALRRSL